MNEEYYNLLHKMSKTKDMKFLKENIHKISNNHYYDISKNLNLSEDIALELSHKSPALMRHPNLPLERLEEVLLSDAYRNLGFLYRNYAVSNPNATEELLLKVIEKYSSNENLMTCITINRGLSLKVLLELRRVLGDKLEDKSSYNPFSGLALESSNFEVIQYLIDESMYPIEISENPNLDEHFINSILDKYWGNYGVTLNLAKHKNSTIEHLEKLSKCDYEWTRAKVAFNKKTSSETLEFLQNDPSANVRKHVAKNPNTPLSVLNYLLDDKSKVVKANAIKILESRKQL